MNLISKKDLLAVTGISYGQLYRWKRQQLIPEEWFIKKASYTGQETFFPREQIISRVQTILQLKDTYSMEQLAAMFAEQAPQNAGLTPEQLQKIEELPQEWRESLFELTGKDSIYFDDLVAIVFIARQSQVPEADKKKLLTVLPQAVGETNGSGGSNSSNSCLGIFQIGGEYHLFILKGTAGLAFDQTITSVAAESWSSIADALRIQYKNLLKM